MIYLCKIIVYVSYLLHLCVDTGKTKDIASLYYSYEFHMYMYIINFNKNDT